MSSFFQRLREKPESVRRRFALLISVCITFVIVSALFIGYLYQAANNDGTDAPLELSNSSEESGEVKGFADFINRVRDGWNTQVSQKLKATSTATSTDASIGKNPPGALITPYIVSTSTASGTVSATSTLKASSTGPTKASTTTSAISTSSSRGNVNGN